jgi:undecaprenyl-diphosphatase
MLESLLLGMVQGLTEFLPVSSSGHLALFQHALGWKDPVLAFDLLLHLATLGAVLLFFASDILNLGGEWFRGLWSREFRRRPGWIYGWALLGGTVLTVCVALPLKKSVEQAFSSPFLVGGALVVTGMVLFLPRFFPRREKKLSLGAGCFIGLVQGMAAFPGISRSGSTIVAGLGLGLSREEAFRFSFLLSVPAIVGGTMLELLEGGGVGSVATRLPAGAWIGALAAFASGYGALMFLRRVVLFGKWHWFGIYCIILGLGTLVWSWSGF